MAEFTFDVNALAGLQSSAETLLREQEEMATARKTRDEEIQRLAAEKVKLAQGAQQVAIDTATKAKTHLDNMDASLSRVNEINDSWMLRAIEPLAEGLKLKNYSRKELLRDVQTEEAALNNGLMRNEFQAQQLRAKSAELDAKGAVADAKLALETGDVEAVATKMNTLKSLRVDAESLREGMIANATEPEIRSFAEQGLISKQRAEEELQVRTSKRLTLESQQRAAIIQNFQVQAAQVEALTDEDLRNPAKIKGIQPQFIDQEIKRRALQQMAWTQQRISTDNMKRAEAFATQDDETLLKSGEQGKAGLTKFAAGEEVKNRAAERAKREQERSVAQIRADAAKQQAVDLMLSSASTKQLREMLQNGGAANGNVTIAGPDGQKMEIGAERVNQALKLKLEVEYGQAQALAGAEVVGPGIDASLSEIERMMGVNPEDTRGIDHNDRVNNLLSMPDLDAETRTGLGIMQSKLKVGAAGTLDPETNIKLMSESLEIAMKSKDAMKQRVLESTGSANKPGMKEYLETGQIQKVESGVPIIATAVMVNEPTGNALYDSATAALAQRIAKSGAERAQGADDLIAQLAQKDYDPVELAAMNAVKPDVQAEMAAGIVAGVVINAHAAAMDAIGKKDIANALRTNTYFADGVLNERQLVETLNRANVNINEYMLKLREAARLSARDLMTPTGKNGHMIAAYNKLLFNNQQETYAESYSVGRLSEAIRGVTQTETSIASGVNSNQSNPLAVSPNLL